MRKYVVRCAAAIGAAAMSNMAFGTGPAAADEFGGLTYGKATEIIGQLNSTVVVAGAVGDRLERDDCIVARSQRDSKNNVILFLNCAGTVASTTGSGPSSASPAGRKAKEDQAVAAWIAADPANCELSKEIAKACEDFCNLNAGMCTSSQ